MADEAKERGVEEGKILLGVNGNQYFFGFRNCFNFTYGIKSAKIYNISTQDYSLIEVHGNQSFFWFSELSIVWKNGHPFTYRIERTKIYVRTQDK